MSRMVDHLNCELENVKHERNILNELVSNDKEDQRLQSLQEECTKKDEEIQKLKSKMESSSTNLNIEGNNGSEYKVILQEISSQLEHYKNKYMKSQQKNEETQIQMVKMELNNQRIEAQVNEEIRRIKSKFQEKLNELCPFPKKLDEANEELKVANKKIAKLENELKEACVAGNKLKNELKKISGNGKEEGLEAKYKQALVELNKIKKYSSELNCAKVTIEKKYLSLQEEFDILKSESAKIIATTKECTEINRKFLHSQIERLEKELTQSWAKNAVSLSEQECAVQHMKEELNELHCNLNESRMQIEYLKNHIQSLTGKKRGLDCDLYDQIDYCRD